MIRKAFTMSVKPGRQDEYRKRHNPIWPELERVLKVHGVHNYSIFLERDTNTLFAYVELESVERWRRIAETPECQRWWMSMKELMPANPDASPMTEDLDEVFHMD